MWQLLCIKDLQQRMANMHREAILCRRQMASMHHIGTKRLDRYHELGQVGTQQGHFAEALRQPSSRGLHCRYVHCTCLTCPRHRVSLALHNVPCPEIVLDLAVCIWCKARLVDHPPTPANSDGQPLPFTAASER